MVPGFISTTFLQEVKQHVRLLVGWGSPPVLLYKRDPGSYKQVYDLMVAPSEGMVDHFRGVGIKAELLRHAFEPRILSKIRAGPERTLPVSFVGLLRAGYSKRRELLEILCESMGGQVFVWASSLNDLPPDSSIRKRHQGHAWGQDIYQILSMSKIGWNSHLEIAGKFADNLRLFEVTGVGALLITDWKENLHKVFEVGKEVLAYRNADECIALIQYYLERDIERNAIALAGQQRTLREHTYCHRMQELVGIVRKNL